MRVSIKFLAILVFSILFLSRTSNADRNGGWNCLSCTVIVSLVEQLAIINNSTIEQSLDKFCDLLPAGLFQYSCQQAVAIFGPVIINGYKIYKFNFLMKMF